MESSIAKYLPGTCLGLPAPCKGAKSKSCVEFAGALALWTSMRYYFHVDNNYVQRKLRVRGGRAFELVQMI
jgi:hypothetical protein